MDALIVLVVLGFVGYLVVVFVTAASSGGGKQIIVVPISDDEVAEVVGKVNTPAQYRQLEARAEAAWDRAGELESDVAIAKAERKAELLDKAVLSAGKKVYAWQFLPDITIDTPLVHLKNAAKVFTLAKLDAAKQKLGNEGWFEVCLGEDPEDLEDVDDLGGPPGMLAALIEFRKVVEAGKDRPATVKAINKVVSQHEVLRDDFTDGDLAPGDEWFAGQLAAAGVPRPELLYGLGYHTLDAVLAIPEAELLQIKGIGPSAVEKINALRAGELVKSA